MALIMGMDIGSGTSKGVIVRNRKPIAYHLLPSGVDYRAVAQKLREELLAKAGLSIADIADTIATGHGAGNVAFSRHRVSDILCCARGITSIFPSVRTIIDVQRISTQVIRLNATGHVINFTINEKCATGSGCFLDIISHVLQIDLKDAGPLSLGSGNPVTFTTGCAVFGESEAISRVSEGASKEDILAGVHRALANKISTLVDRVGLEMDCAMSGGGGLNIGLVESVEKKLGFKLLVSEQPQFINAIGAAIMAENGVEMGGSLPEPGSTIIT
ncbi:MAG: acyl-CoA dehydratase activase [Syntrophales bacterium]|nr:acyl-CoA dehydratase activase [Syntrophales bacterium]